MHLLSIEKPPTAIFACNDLMSIGALSAAGETGYPVPDKLAVIGFDNIELASYSNPPLTTIAQPKAAICQTAVNLLLKHINDKSHPAQRVCLPGALVTRKSCGGHR